MDISKKIISALVLLGAVSCLYFYSLIFFSSIRFEHNKALVNQDLSETSIDALLTDAIPTDDTYWFAKTIIRNPVETELFLRAKLLASQLLSFDNVLELKTLYAELLEGKPTWPYYFSGILQLSMVDSSSDINLIESAVKYGPHEKKVIISLAEVLFYHWDNLNKVQRDSLLNYLSNQSEATIAKVVMISAKFARIYEYCDFLYDKKQVEYAACKRQYWQPLSNIE